MGALRTKRNPMHSPLFATFKPANQQPKSATSRPARPNPTKQSSPKATSSTTESTTAKAASKVSPASSSSPCLCPSTHSPACPHSYPSVTAHQARVYAAISQIPTGSVATYAGLAAVLASSPRAVGGALKRNPWAPEVPCHRVIGADGGIGGFKGEYTAHTSLKLGLLRKEGVEFDGAARIVDKSRIWNGFVV